MVKILLHAEIDTLSEYMDAAILAHIKTRQVERFESLDAVCLMAFDWYDIVERYAMPAQVIIYFSAQHLFFICEEERLAAKVRGLVKEYPENDKMLYHFFAELMKPDMDNLEAFEDEIAELENNLILNSKTQCAKDIVMQRKELIRLKKYYEQLNSIFEDLTQNENNLITQAHLRYYMVLDNRVDRLFGTVLNLRDFVSQVREAYQAQIDIEQNAIMKVFTVMTSVFLPLTLIVGWYGMNLQMPEFGWRYGYPLVIGFSVIVCLSCLAFFKIKKWF